MVHGKDFRVSRTIRRFIYTLHRISGSIVALFLLMWFVSGIVLLYHSFPNLTDSDKFARMEVIQADSLPQIVSVLTQIPKNEKIKTFELRNFNGQNLFRINSKYRQLSDSPSFHTIEKTAKRWSSANIRKVDTLFERDIWIMYSRYEKELPIYKFEFDDKEKHQLYISSKSGEPLQFTSSSQRFWAYLGAIPHKLYIPALRKNTERWINTITILAIISFIATLSGIYAGTDVYVRQYRNKKRITSPYKKRWYRWHHVFGMVFGVFLLLWTISGMISLNKIPQWIAKSYMEIPSQIKGKAISIDSYNLDYRTLVAKYPKLKSIEWSYFQGKPIYIAIIDSTKSYIDASGSEIKPLYLEEEIIEKAITQNHGDIPYKIELISNYENYYLPWKGALDLPVYKVSVSDEDKSTYYINPKTGEYKYLNNNRKYRKWLFGGIHFFHIKWLMERPLIWAFLIWTAALGCVIVSLSGVILGWRYLCRKYRQLRTYLR